MTDWSRRGLVSVLLWGAITSAVTAQELAAPDLERAAAAEVQRREALGNLRRDGTDPTSGHRPRAIIVHDNRERGLDAVARSVNGELSDVARAFRRLDQSYAIRGFQGCAASTAGSVFIDWRAKGVRPQDRPIVLPPEPIVLGRPKAALCSPICGSCGHALLGEGGSGCGCQPTNLNILPTNSDQILTPSPSLPPLQADRPCCETSTTTTHPLQPTPSPIVAPRPTPTAQ